MRETTRIQSLLFDFDGVLLDSEPVHFSCWQQALGVKLDWDRYARECIGISERATVETIARWERADPDLLWQQYSLKQILFQQVMCENPPFAPGLADFIAALAQRFRLAVVTSSSRTEIEPLLVRAGIRPYFGALVCAEDVAHHKPAPDAYLLAARLLGVETALVIEDSDSGMESARRAGFEALRVPSAAQMIPLVLERIANPQ